ncbi:hypothetical protein KXD40_008042 [Peronospora effusa]|uniref:Tudor-knot domain-containing protein n=1 Tax=Peronospora effusa TaxID=542832 RepID=A0A3M6VBF2_9STRA|nr:hypothetical protein DD238_007073 [Peronospora effusa]RQM12416.1 hypothetical protein DD237_000963 [Peronospora effusa]UIZ24193.1 hypothetical protein KXD40_008042 [Peronospora effusa]
MVIKVGDTVLVYYDLLIFDAKVYKIERDTTGWTDNWDTWVSKENIMEDLPANRERQKQAKDELLVQCTTGVPPSIPLNKRPTTVPGSERLVSMIGWLKTLDDFVTKLDKQVKDLIRQQLTQEVEKVQWKKRKLEAQVHKMELEVEVARDLKRVKVAEETAMARKRLKDAGVTQDEIDAILPTGTR